jgi:DNA polymerase-4
MTECSDIVWQPRAILHVDMDAFFAAVEQLDHPEWRGKPVIVGGSAEKRGVVSTCSYEARVFGVRSAMASARAKVLCPDAIWAPPRFERYSEFSHKVRDIFAEETPDVQPVSVDEAYLDVTPGRYAGEDPVRVAERIQAKVAELGLSCSVGLATSKTVAKIASDFRKPAGLTVVCPGDEADFLAPLPIRALPGIGPKSAERFDAAGVHTLGDIAALDEQSAEALAGSMGRSLVSGARGIDDRDVHDNEPRKSISNERTFSKDLHDRDEVEGVMSFLVAKVCSRMRNKDAMGSTVSIKVRYADFTTRSAQRTLDAPTCDEQVVADVVDELLDSLWSEGVGVRLLGVGVSGFDEVGAQLQLTPVEEADDVERRNAIVEDIDRINERFGAGTVSRGTRRGKDPRRRDEEL